jgi:hypothetical protein
VVAECVMLIDWFISSNVILRVAKLVRQKSGSGSRSVMSVVTCHLASASTSATKARLPCPAS